MFYSLFLVWYVVVFTTDVFPALVRKNICISHCLDFTCELLTCSCSVMNEVWGIMEWWLVSLVFGHGIIEMVGLNEWSLLWTVVSIQ